jgi:DNA-binding MarR family transcriptional regulator
MGCPVQADGAPLLTIRQRVLSLLYKEFSGHKLRERNMTDIKNLLNEYKSHQDHWAVEMNMLIGRVAIAQESHYNKEHEQYKITHPSASILYALMEKGGKMTQKQISSKLPVTKQAITASLKILEKRGLVTREVHSHDRRKRWVTLTEKGVDFLSVSMPLRSSFYEKLTSCLTKKEGDAVTTILTKVSKFYEKEINKLDRARKKIKAQPDL